MALLYKSPENAVEISESTLSFPDVSYVAIYDNKQNLLYEAGERSQHEQQAISPIEKKFYYETKQALHFSMPVITGINGQEEESPFASKVDVQETIGFGI